MRRACLVALALVAGCAPALDWREFRNDEAGVAQLFPCRPIRQQRKLRLVDRELTLVMHVCDAGDASWALAHCEVGDPAAVGPALAALAEAAHRNLGRKPGPAQAHAVPGATPNAQAGRWTVRGQAPDGRAMQAAVLVFAIGTQVVQATALGTGLKDGDTETFLGSARSIR